MIFKNVSLTPEQFLADYWQKKPLLIRQALPGFTPELDSDDIAGLACDELAESRLVTGSFPEHDWKVRYGPFRANDFKKLPGTHWTLLAEMGIRPWLISLFSRATPRASSCSVNAA